MARIKIGDLITLKPSIRRFYNGKQPPIYLVTKVARVRSLPCALVDMQRLGETKVIHDVKSDIYVVLDER